MVTPFTVSISTFGDVELLSIGGIAPLPPTSAHTTRFTEHRMCAPLSSWHKLFILWSILLTHSCTDKFSLCDHPELPLYTIQCFRALLMHVLDAVYTRIWLQTPLPFCRTPLFLNPLHVVYGRGWSHRPTIPFLFGWYTSQTSLIIILYPARDPATFCCFSRLRSYFRPTASSSWRGNALGFPKPQIMGSPWPP